MDETIISFNLMMHKNNGNPIWPGARFGYSKFSIKIAKKQNTATFYVQVEFVDRQRMDWPQRAVPNTFLDVCFFFSRFSVLQRNETELCTIQTVKKYIHLMGDLFSFRSTRETHFRFRLGKQKRVSRGAAAANSTLIYVFCFVFS